MDPFLARDMLSGNGSARGRVWSGLGPVTDERDYTEAIQYDDTGDTGPPLGTRGGRETAPARFARVLATYLDNGIGILALIQIILYGVVGIAHQLFYTYFPVVGEYLQSLDVGTALILVTLVVFQVLTQDIAAARDSYPRKPRALFGILQAYTRIADRIRIHVGATGQLEHCPELVRDVYDQLRLLAGSSVHLFVEISEGRGMGPVVDQYLGRLRHLKRQLIELEACDVLSTADRIEITHAIGDSVESTLEDVRFSVYFTGPSFVENHMRLSTIAYLWLILPALLYSTLGSTMWAFYIAAMFIFDMIIRLSNLVGDPFNFYNSRYQPNNYVEWERDHIAVINEHEAATLAADQ